MRKEMSIRLADQRRETKAQTSWEETREGVLVTGMLLLFCAAGVESSDWIVICLGDSRTDASFNQRTYLFLRGHLPIWRLPR